MQTCRHDRLELVWVMWQDGLLEVLRTQGKYVSVGKFELVNRLPNSSVL